MNHEGNSTAKGSFSETAMLYNRRHQNKEDFLAQIWKLKEENEHLRMQLRASQEAAVQAAQEFNLQQKQLNNELRQVKASEERLKRVITTITNHGTRDTATNSSESTEIETLKKLVEHLQNRIDRRNARILDLEEALKKKSNSVEVEKLQNRLQRAKLQLEKLTNIERQKADLETKLAHCESEYEILHDMLSVTNGDPIDGPWTQLRDCIRREKELRQKLAESEKLLIMKTEKLEGEISRQSSVLADEMSHQTEDFNAQIDDLHKQIEELQATNARIGKFTEQQKIRMLFAKTITQTHTNVITKLRKLHSTVKSESDEPVLRPLIVSVALLIRWSRLYQHTTSTAYDSMSLLSFTRVPSFSFDGQVDSIIQKFGESVKEIVSLKEQMREEMDKSKQLKNEIAELTTIRGDGKTEIETLRMTLETQKERMAKLQEELALAVPPAKMQEVITKNTGLELELDSQKEEVRILQQALNDKTLKLNQMSLEVKEKDAEAEARMEELQELQAVSKKRCQEIEVLKMRLNEKTKELLALERLVDGKHGTYAVVPGEVPSSPKINPAFLGKTE